ncbi:MAG: lysophospholipid acyltransferase family protein [Saprospiraceae bacterium]
MQRTELLLITILVHLIGLLPFRMLYFLSDFLALFFIHFIHYRRKTIRTNLRNSFPEKTAAEIDALECEYYHHLCDILLESIKGLTMPAAELQRRFALRNPEIFHPLFEKNESAIVLASHFGNWEWGVLSLPLGVRHRVVGIYKPLSNPYINDYLNRRRKKWGLHLTSMTGTGRTVVKYRSHPSLFVLIADQTPSDVKHAHWLPFLHQDTPFHHGADKLARQTGYPVFMVDIRRRRRGFYDVEFTELCRQPAQTKDGDITALYAEKLEHLIRENPSQWLWSHRRWKRKRPGPLRG